MLAVYKKNNIVVDVEPFYLYGRIVAYVGKLYLNPMIRNVMDHPIGTGSMICEKYAYLPDELDFENVKR